MPILTGAPPTAPADPAAASRSSSRSSRKTRCSMCQSAVCSRTAAPSTSAQAWVIAVARCRVVPASGTSTAGWKVMTMPQPRPPPLVPDRHRVQRAPLGERQGGGAERHPGGVPAEVDLDAAGGEVAVGEQRDDARPAAGLAQRRERVDPTGERDDRHAERLAELEELLEDLLGLQPLGHGGDRPEVRGAPGAGEVPVAEVAEEGDDRAAAVDDLAHRAVALDPHPVEELVGGEHRQAERLAVVAQAAPHALADQGVEPGVVEVGADPGVVGPQPGGTATGHGDVGDPVEHRVGGALGHQAQCRPPDAEPGDRQRVADLRRQHPHTRSRAWRRTSSMRCTTVTRLARASSPSTTASTTSGRNQPTSPVADEHDDQPVGPLGDADVGGHAEPLGARLGVGHDAAEDEAGQGEGRHVGLARLVGVEEHEPPKMAASPTRSSVESR